MFRRSDTPPWPRRGGRDIKKDVAKPLGERTPLLGQGGVTAPLRKYRVATLAQARWFVKATYYRKLNKPPCPLHQRKLRGILLMSRPPLLDQGGECACFK